MPAFISKRLHPYTACRWLRSSGQNLIVRLWRPKMKGNHALGIENLLQLHLKSVDSNETLKELICIDLLFPSGNYCCVFISALFFVDCCGKEFHLEMCYINMFYLFTKTSALGAAHVAEYTSEVGRVNVGILRMKLKSQFSNIWFFICQTYKT